MKTKKIVYTFLMAFFIFPATNAQSSANAVKVVNDMMNLLKTNAISTNFVMTVKEPTSTQPQSINGNFTMKENKFILNTEEMNVYFDGKTQSAYMTSVNEVSITNPTEKELAETNPLAVLSAYKNKSVIKFAKKNPSKTVHAIELTPKDQNSTLKKILVNVNKSNNYPLFVQLTDKKGAISTLTLSQFKTGLKIMDASFVFNPKKYKDIEINDLR